MNDALYTIVYHYGFRVSGYILQYIIPCSAMFVVNHMSEKKSSSCAGLKALG